VSTGILAALFVAVLGIPPIPVDVDIRSGLGDLEEIAYSVKAHDVEGYVLETGQAQ
jgi:hypothetical protein